MSESVVSIHRIEPLAGIMLRSPLGEMADPFAMIGDTMLPILSSPHVTDQVQAIDMNVSYSSDTLRSPILCS